MANHALSRTTRAYLSKESLAASTRQGSLSSGVRCAIDAGNADLLRHQQVLRCLRSGCASSSAGWSTRFDDQGNVVRSAQALKVGDRLRNRFVDGSRRRSLSLYKVKDHPEGRCMTNEKRVNRPRSMSSATRRRARELDTIIKELDQRARRRGSPRKPVSPERSTS